MRSNVSRVFMTIILCIIRLGTSWALLPCFNYPRYFMTTSAPNYILSMDMHFPTDLLVYVGSSYD
jgi:hypothetical protein